MTTTSSTPIPAGGHPVGRLDGHACLVTGGGRGIGRAIALELAGRGADVAIVDANAASAEAVEQEVRALGRNALSVAADVGDPAAVEAACKAALAGLPDLDILINNAGITRDKLLWRLDTEDWDLVIKVDLTAAFHFTRHVSRAMAKRRFGRVVNIASVIGQMGNAGQSNYAAAKAGLIGFTMSAAKELAGRGITVNAVAPGYIETAMTAGLPDETKQAMLAHIPAGRFGLAEDVAHVVAFLASQESSYITGQVLRVDGGMLMG